MTGNPRVSIVDAPGEPLRERTVAFDYLRSFGVLLVLLHHAVLAYVTFGFLNPYVPMQTFSPIAEAVFDFGVTWSGFDRLVLVNDTFFMPLLFLVSGLFVWQSLKHKGVFGFFLGRLKRLGIPFVIGLVIITPLAYYPTVLALKLAYGMEIGFWQFVGDFFRSGMSETGPLWFVSLLLAFDLVISLIYAVFGRFLPTGKARRNIVLDNPLVFVVLLFGLSIAAYLPMARTFGVSEWLSFGPFRVQISRLFIYLLYFLSGVALGARGLQRSALRSDGLMAKYWWAWALAGAAAYSGLSWIFALAPESPFVVYVFLAEMALMVVALTALFVRFARRGVGILNSLSRNSYGIYLLHYLVVIWLQYAILRTNLAVGWKASIVFFGGLAICWMATAALRRIPAVRKVI